MTISEPVVDRLIYTREEAATQLGISLGQMNELIARGEIESFKMGRLRKIPREALVAYVQHKRAAAAK